MSFRRRFVRDINLLPREYRKRSLWKPAGVSVAVACLIAALVWVPWHLRERNEVLRVQIAEREKQATISAPILRAFRQLAEVEADVKHRLALAERPSGWLWLEGVLTRMAESVMEGVYVTKIEIPVQGSILIEGRAPDLGALLGTVHRLEAEAGLKGLDVELPAEFEDSFQYRVIAVVD